MVIPPLSPGKPPCSAEIDTLAAPAYIRWERGIEERMTKGTFGEGLKREREMRGVSLDEISAATRIATRFLNAIEREQWDQLPGGVFNRGFVRAVARYLGLDEENTVAEYVLAVGDRPSVPVWTGSPPAVTSEQPWAAWIIAAIIVIALIAGGWFGARRVIAWRAARRAAQNAAASEALPSPATGLTANSATAPSDSAANPDATIVNEAAPGAPPTPAWINLKIEAGKNTKVTVEADSDPVFDGTMKAGEDHSFTAKDHFDVSTRDAGALQLELNGKTLAPIGAPGQAGKVTVTREALKSATGGTN
jgi:cytoskeleton protein RodZ